MDPSSHRSGENPQAQDVNDEPAPQPGNGREDSEESMLDGPGVENGEIDGKAVWEREVINGAALILDGHARLGDYDSGRDDLSQKIQVGKSTRLAYSVRIETDEQRPPSDRLLVRLTNRQGEQLAVLERHASGDGAHRGARR